MFTSRRLPRHGSIRSSAGSLNSPESKSSEVLTSVKQLEADIRTFIELYNNNPKPSDLGFCQTLLLQSSADIMWRRFT
jgi:hypothetical protein